MKTENIQKLSDAADAFSKKKAELRQAKENLDVLLEMQQAADRPDAMGLFTLKVESRPPFSFQHPAPLETLVAGGHIAPIVIHQLLPPVITAQQGHVTDLEMEMQELADQLVLCATE